VPEITLRRQRLQQGGRTRLRIAERACDMHDVRFAAIGEELHYLKATIG
jgi:hypothetical protein